MNDSFAYVPLFLAAVSALVTVILLFIRRSGGKAALASRLAAAFLLCAGSVCAVINPSLTLFAVFVALSAAAGLLSALLQPKEGRAEPEQADGDFAVAADLPDDLPEQDDAAQRQREEIGTIVEAGREFMIRAAGAFSEEGGLNTLLDYVNGTLIKQTGADGGVVLLLDDFDDVLAVKVLSGDFPPPYKLPDDLPHKIVRVETNFRFSQFPLDQTIFGAVARSGRAELVVDPLSDGRIYQNETEDFLKCGTYIFIPLKIRDTVIGVAAVARRFTSEPFTEKEFDTAVALGDLASTAIKVVYSYQEVVEHSELTKESGIACKLQKSLHPKLLPAIPSLSLGCYYQTADGVCGDYYDIVPARKDRISFIVGDVAGKGMNSLMIMVMLRAILRLTVNTTQSAGTILGWANRGVITGENNLDHFASIALINYDSVAGTVQIATAGTTPVLLYSAASGSMEVVSDDNEPVGVEKTTEYKDKEFPVHSGDIIVTYTDGLVEIPDSRGVQYSQERLMQIVKKNRQLSGKEIADMVKSDITKFSESSHQHDDQTLLIIKVQ